MKGRPRVSIPEGLRARFADLPGRARALREDTERRFPIVTRLAARLLSVNVLDAATRLAAQAFLTAVPLLFVIASLAPESVRKELLDSLVRVLGLSGPAREQLRSVYESDPGSLRQTVGVVGILMALLSATACSRAMQRVCERAWHLPKSAARIAAWRWFAWVCAALVYLAIQGPLREGFGAGRWLGVPLSLVSAVGIWWWTQHLLLGGRIGWWPLLPGALLTAVLLEAAVFAAPLYVPKALNRSLQAYGSLGSVFTLLSGLIALCVVATVCLTVGAVFHGDEPAPGAAPAVPAAPGPPGEGRAGGGQAVGERSGL
ncbi:YhjD/YihY/BrkB family envelope integrity protein [Actinacidiphila glaucinigra]|uniref:YhjD/YihY/BrkB family envelope integrity protein n=1 Tax=Actinacidiphila glaucinigra TaxID=235986 RepID=UPI002E32DDD5|nr:YhjD/YihY/BrkB family envelope integrity protein [Actinacidiphila glaucinigra]